MADTKVRIIVDADADTAVREINRVDRAVDGMSTSTDKAGESHRRLGTAVKAGAAGLVGIAVGAAAFGKSAVEAFSDAEAATARAERMLDQNNQGWRRHRTQIDATIQAHSRLGAFDDEDLMVSFANLSRVTGDTNEAMRLQSLAMDIARGKGISLESATTLVVKAQNGQLGGLKKLGLEIDKNTTSHEALAMAQQRFAGQAAAYGRTTAGQAENISIAWGNFKETVGQALLPAVNALMQAFTRAMPTIQEHAERVSTWFREHWPEIKEVLAQTWAAVQRLWKIVEPILGLFLDVAREVVGWIADHWDQISTVISVVAAVIEKVIKTQTAILREVLAVWVAVAEGIINAVQAIAGPVSAAAQAVWSALVTAVTAPIDFAGWLNRQIVQPVTGFLTTATDRGRAVATAIWGGVTGFVTDMAGWIRNRIIEPITDGLTTIQDRGAAISRNIWAGVTGFVTDMVGWIRNRIIEPITERLPAVLAKGADIAEKIWAGLRSVSTDMAGWVRDHVIAPITDRLDAVLSKGTDIAEAIATGMRRGAASVVDSVKAAFRTFLNGIINVINMLPFVQIPHLAEGGVVRGPTFALVGEDGDEVVVPVSAKHRDRGHLMLQQAANLLGVTGDIGQPASAGSHAAIRAANTMGLPVMGLGGWVRSAAGSAGHAIGAGASAALGGIKDGAAAAWGTASDLARRGVGYLIDLLPDVPAFEESARSVAGALARGVRGAAADYLTGIFESKDQWGQGGVGDAAAWAREAVNTGTYVYSGGHGGWDFALPKGYDCSGFASHAAKKAGSTISSPMDTGGTYASAKKLAAPGAWPAVWGWRGDLQAGGKNAHMGIRLGGTWYSFGPAIGDDRWNWYGIPPGLPGYRTGIDYVPRTGPAVIHAGEAVLNRQAAAEYRAGQGSGITVIGDGTRAGEFIASMIRVEVDGMAADSRLRARAAGGIR